MSSKSAVSQDEAPLELVFKAQHESTNKFEDTYKLGNQTQAVLKDFHEIHKYVFSLCSSSSPAKFYQIYLCNHSL